MTDGKTTLHEQQEKAIDTLGDWSKWMIGISFSAGTGCIMVIQQGVSPVIKPFLLIAIFFLALAIVLAVVIFLTLPLLIQALPMGKAQDKVLNIYDYKVGSKVSLRSLLTIQIGLLILGLVFLFLWVVLKPTAI